MDEYPIIDLSHLLPAAQGLARLPADERIQRLRADRWIGYPRAVEALIRRPSFRYNLTARRRSSYEYMNYS
ncbi:hypothetical protein ONM54_004202 [Escherichia coli]|nr:hypothetical protein [Escherichia coli]